MGICPLPVLPPPRLQQTNGLITEDLILPKRRQRPLRPPPCRGPKMRFRITDIFLHANMRRELNGFTAELQLCGDEVARRDAAFGKKLSKFFQQGGRVSVGSSGC